MGKAKLRVREAERFGESGVQLVGPSEWPGAVPIFSGSHQLRDLADVSDVVQRPFMQHLGKRDLPDFRVIRLPLSRPGRQILQKFDVVRAVFCETIEGVIGIGISIEVEMHLRVVSFEKWLLFFEEAIQPHAVAVAIRVGEVGKHLSDRKAIGSRFPASIIVRDFPHEAAQDLRRRFQKVKARQVAFGHGKYATTSGRGLCGWNLRRLERQGLR